MPGIYSVKSQADVMLRSEGAIKFIKPNPSLTDKELRPGEAHKLTLSSEIAERLDKDNRICLFLFKKGFILLIISLMTSYLPGCHGFRSKSVGKHPVHIDFS